MRLTGPLVETHTNEMPRILVEDAVPTRTAASQPTLEFLRLRPLWPQLMVVQERVLRPDTLGLVRRGLF
jgi:hypothetical protein